MNIEPLNFEQAVAQARKGHVIKPVNHPNTLIFLEADSTTLVVYKDSNFEEIEEIVAGAAVMLRNGQEVPENELVSLSQEITEENAKYTILTTQESGFHDLIKSRRADAIAVHRNMTSQQFQEVENKAKGKVYFGEGLEQWIKREFEEPEGEATTA